MNLTERATLIARLHRLAASLEAEARQLERWLGEIERPDEGVTE